MMPGKERTMKGFSQPVDQTEPSYDEDYRDDSLSNTQASAEMNKELKDDKHRIDRYSTDPSIQQGTHGKIEHLSQEGPTLRKTTTERVIPMQQTTQDMRKEADTKIGSRPLDFKESDKAMAGFPNEGGVKQR